MDLWTLLAVFVLLLIGRWPRLPVGTNAISARLALARSAGNRAAFLQTLRSAPKDFALKLAAQYGEAEVVRELIEAGARPDGFPMPQNDYPDDHSPLIAAVLSGSEEIVRMLIAAGADVNRKVPEGDLDEVCAIDIAAGRGEAGIVKLLLEHGAEASGVLWAEAFENHAEVLMVLLQHGDLISALKDAIEFDHTSLVKLLLEHGADVDVLKDCDRPDPDVSASLLARIGAHGHAADIVHGATGAEFPVPDKRLLLRARKLDSLFVASAERFAEERKFASARRLCEWKLSRGASLLHTSVCLRVQARMQEQEGNAADALRLYRDALGAWQLDSRPEVWASADANRAVPTELRALLHDCERIFAELGMSEDRERVAAILTRLG